MMLSARPVRINDLIEFIRPDPDRFAGVKSVTMKVLAIHGDRLNVLFIVPAGVHPVGSVLLADVQQVPEKEKKKRAHP